MSPADDQHLVELLRRALEALDEDAPARARVLSRLGQELKRHIPEQRRDALTNEALESARRSGDLRMLGAVLLDRYWVSSGPIALEERLALADEIVAVSRRCDDRALLMQGMQCQLHAKLEQGDITGADRAARLRNGLAAELGSPDMLYAVASYDVLQATMSGRFDDAERLADRARAMRERTNPVHAARLYGVQLTNLRWLQGRLAELTDAQEQLARGSPQWTDAAQAVLVLVYAESGRHAEAAAVLSEFVGRGLDSVPRDYDWAATMACLAVACERLNDGRRALPVYDQLAPYRDRNCMVGQLGFGGAVSHHVGALAALMGRWEEAAENLEHAMDRHRAMGARPFVALSQEVHGRVLLLRGHPGDVELARRELLEAAETAEELGMSALADRARRSMAFAVERGPDASSGVVHPEHLRHRFRRGADSESSPS